MTQDHSAQKINDERATRDSLDVALARFMTLTESLPFVPCMSDFFSSFRELAKADFNIRGARWLNAFELGAIAKWVWVRIWLSSVSHMQPTVGEPQCGVLHG